MKAEKKDWEITEMFNSVYNVSPTVRNVPWFFDISGGLFIRYSTVVLQGVFQMTHELLFQSGDNFFYRWQ